MKFVDDDDDNDDEFRKAVAFTLHYITILKVTQVNNCMARTAIIKLHNNVWI